VEGVVVLVELVLAGVLGAGVEPDPEDSLDVEEVLDDDPLEAALELDEPPRLSVL
jgi:hypothetical protein